MSAIELKSTVQLQDSGGTYSTIGISDAIKNHTMAEILDFIYCSASTDFWQDAKQATTGIYSQVASSPYHFQMSGTNILLSDGDEGYDIGLYGKVVWLYGTSLSTFENPATSNACVITNMDVKKFVMYIYNPSPGYESSSFRTFWGNDWQVRQANSWSDVGKAFDLNCGLYFQDNGGENFTSPQTGGTDTHRHAVVNVKPYIILPALNGTYYFAGIMDEYNHGGSSGYLFNTSATIWDSLKDSSNSSFSWSPNCIPNPTSVSYWQHGMSFYGTYSTGYYSVDFHSGRQYNAYSPITLKCVPNTLDSMNKVKMMSGIWFYTNKLYKPIIVDGYVTGYGNPTDESDYDNYTYSRGNQHDVPPAPPAPGPSGSDEDEDTAISTAGAPFAKGLVNYYAMTAGSTLIEHISDALSTWDLQNTGKDLYKNLVSCKLIKPPAAIPTTGSEPFTIYGEKPQYEGADISLPVVSGNPDATFGPYTITRKFNDFRDFAPYTRVCIYLPYCGWCDLPSHVVGRTVSVHYYTDIIAATVRAVVFCGNNIVAEAAGVMGLDIPFTADAVGSKMAGVANGLTAYAGGALQAAAGVAQMVAGKDTKAIGQVLSGGSKLISAYTQTAIAFNENTTEISGKNGDGCCLSGATDIIIKIIRPKYGASSTAPYVPAGFAHAVGFVSNKQVRVGNVTGLLIADNVDTSGIAGATDAERAEIKRVLETGLIINTAPE